MPTTRIDNFRIPQVSSTNLDLTFLNLSILKNNSSLIKDKDSTFFSFNIQWSGTPTALIFNIILEWDIKGTCFDKIPIYKLRFNEKAVGISNTGYSILSDDRDITVSTVVDDKKYQLILTYDKSQTSIISENGLPSLSSTASMSCDAEYTNE